MYHIRSGKNGINKLQMNRHLFSLGSATVSLTWPSQTLWRKCGTQRRNYELLFHSRNEASMEEFWFAWWCVLWIGL
jgi:hypothetical protein